MASLREVADAAGVGLGTASRALNGTGYVSEEKKKMILKAAEELHYRQNMSVPEPAEHHAGLAAKGKTGIVGLSVPDMEQPFFAGLLKYLEIELHKLGYHVMMFNSLGVSNRVEEIVEMLEQHIIDGAILNTTESDIPGIGRVGSRIVAYECRPAEGMTQVYSDHRQGGRMAAEEFLRCGCKKVLQISSDSTFYTPSSERHRILEEILSAEGTEVITVRLAWTNILSYDYYRRSIEEYLRLYPDADGVFVEDISAYFALKHAEESGISVPEKRKIVGYDGLDLTRICQPVITTIVQDIPAIAKIAAGVLVKQINGEFVEQNYVIPVYFQKGGTT